ncbi:DUF3768 domain-containing protein [Novosphingobium terrae]|uniref:DUF3768 domain-containing protein n=1 Tax=Novosphingobium terrae TaxID=2726189 RepID=UPI00197F78B0|nr:DUF3768 domain-containing protein [Novosphingobium terrae]
MATQTKPNRTEAIARLNDRARQGLDRNARVVTTRSCLAAFCDLDNFPAMMLMQAALLRAVRHCTFAETRPERDFAAIPFRDRTIWLTIGYYDAELVNGSEDPADASKTTRVLTIMLPEDY